MIWNFQKKIIDAIVNEPSEILALITNQHKKTTYQTRNELDRLTESSFCSSEIPEKRAVFVCL